MSKLLKLKQWLTVPDAAKYLTEACEEDVTEADVLRFALDGQLTLSVYFLNEHPKAKRASYIPCKDSRLCGVLGLEGESLPYTDLDLLDVTDGQVELSGVWNLPMIAGDRLALNADISLKPADSLFTR